MKFNLYSYDLFNSVFTNVESNSIPNSLNEKLITLEYEIINEFLKKQETRPGIKKLGNEIRLNRAINDIFKPKKTEKEILIKLTAHYHSYLNTIINSLFKYPDQTLYFFVLQENFRGSSRLVDSSSKGAHYIKVILDKLSSVFNPIKKGKKVYIVEMKGFTEYSVVQILNYSKIIKK